MQSDAYPGPMLEHPAWTCWHCGRSSWNPNDGLHGFCGACDHFCADRDAEIERALGPGPSCPKCGAPTEPQTKWNSGNPKVIDFPTCTCAEDEAEARLDVMLAALRQREP